MRSIVFLLLLISWALLCVSGQTTTPASLEKWTYTCQSKLAKCPVGFEVAVDELYMTTDRNCPTESPVLGPCQVRMNVIILAMQQSLCNGVRVCNIIDVSGYQTECGITTFGIIIYRCNFDGYPLFTETTPVPTSTQPTPMPVASTYCEPANMTCPRGQLINVIEVQYAAKTVPCEQTADECCAYDVTDCVQRVSGPILSIQRNICLDKAACSSIDLTGYVMFCNGMQYLSSYGIVRYSCYEGPTTTIATKVSRTATTKTPTLKTPTTKTPTSKTLTTTTIKTTTTLTPETPTLPTVTTRKSTPVSTWGYVSNFKHLRHNRYLA
ncbi:uncharacterized protein LOC135461711 [Liolophura sinensis]|uniref:uncharacterized protein LOC135461711 n=1 Tax=Liolophura sinensis TaxID=3198878 RepID=UPI003158EE3D